MRGDERPLLLVGCSTQERKGLEPPGQQSYIGLSKGDTGNLALRMRVWKELREEDAFCHLRQLGELSLGSC